MPPAPLVVVVEDDFTSRTALRRVLRAGGYDVAMYTSAEEFLASPPVQPAVGLLLDIHLGGLSGLDLQRRLSAEGRAIPVIIITASDSLRTEEEAKRLGCLGYLRKPCDGDTILALLGSLPSRPASAG
jgi:FixJ family two-component response regulator